MCCGSGSCSSGIGTVYVYITDPNQNEKLDPDTNQNGLDWQHCCEEEQIEIDGRAAWVRAVESGEQLLKFFKASIPVFYSKLYALYPVGAYDIQEKLRKFPRAMEQTDRHLTVEQTLYS
jgi:hypothetical protein